MLYFAISRVILQCLGMHVDSNNIDQQNESKAFSLKYLRSTIWILLQPIRMQFIEMSTYKAQYRQQILASNIMSLIIKADTKQEYQMPY